MNENYFNPRAKNDIKDLYNREISLTKLKNAINNKKPGIVISGLRRIGKTSLVKTVLSELEYSIFIDVWSGTTRTTISRNEVLRLFSSAIGKFLKNYENVGTKIVKKIKKLRGANLQVLGTGGGLNFDGEPANEENLSELFDQLNQWAIENNKTVVIAIDEVQELSKATDVDLRKLFASLYNNSNLILILSGSLVGTLKKFIGKRNLQSPFFGKVLTDIPIEPLTLEQSREFLLKGFEQNNFLINTVLYEPIIDSTINRLGGIIGLLVIFGNNCIDNEIMSEQFLDSIEEDNSPQSYQDYKDFIDIIGLSEKYDEIMHSMALLPYSVFNERYGDKSEVKPYLNNLINGKFVKNEKGRYIITDPLLRYYLLHNPEHVEQSSDSKHRKKSSKKSKKSQPKKPKRKNRR